VLPEHVINVAVLPPGTPTDDIVVAGVRPGELSEILLPLPLQPWCGAFSVPLEQREHLPPPADEVVQLGTLAPE
jgi:hypothetical protein